jgi:uncharacterized protein (TIGR03086 family)
VREVVQHLVAGNQLFARALAGDPSPTEVPEVAAGGWPSTYDASADALLAAFSAPGVLERVVTVPFGSVPGAVALHLRLVENLVHGWDLARATGQQPQHDDAVAEAALAFTLARLGDVPAGRSPFAPPQPAPDDSPAIDRLAAALGRRVEPT